MHYVMYCWLLTIDYPDVSFCGIHEVDYMVTTDVYSGFRDDNDTV